MSRLTDAYRELAARLSTAYLGGDAPGIAVALHELHVAVAEAGLTRPTQIAPGHVVCYGAGLLKTVAKVHCEHMFRDTDHQTGDPQPSNEFEFLGYVPVWGRKDAALDRNPRRAESLAVRG